MWKHSLISSAIGFTVFFVSVKIIQEFFDHCEEEDKQERADVCDCKSYPNLLTLIN